MDLNIFPNEILEQIFQHLDTDAKLQVMETCSRFESLIVQNASLCRDMKLIVNDEKLADPGNREALKNVRRNFAEVHIVGSNLLNNKDRLDTVLGMLERIGMSINSLTISNMMLSNEVFLKIIKLVNPKIMKLQDVQFTGGVIMDGSLEKLTNLRCQKSSNSCKSNPKYIGIVGDRRHRK
jgi:hypothetical protein